MDDINYFLSKLNELKELLIKNGFIDDKSLSELLKRSEENDSETQLKVIIEKIESMEPKDIERFGFVVRKSQLISEQMLSPTDQTDSVFIDLKSQLVTRFKDLLMSPKVCGEEIVLIRAKKIKSNKYGDIYPMTSRPRGFCLIIDNQLFKGLPYRTGSRADADRLSDVFNQLFFDVFRYSNKTTEEIKLLLKTWAQNEGLVGHDAFALIILSHGTKEGIYGTAGPHDLITVDTILEFFNNQNCPLLRNKPKMFFLSACRGDKIDEGAPFHFSTTRSLGRSLNMSDHRMSVTSTWSDIFVYYSSVSGYASLRNTRTGSWFGYELAHCLAEFSHREHLHDLVTIKVGEKLQNRITQMNGNYAKQAIETQTKGSVKKVYFNPGLSQ